MVGKKNQNLLLIVILLLVLPLIVVACGDDDDDDNGGSSDLSQTFEGAGYKVQLPEGWEASAEGSELMIASKEGILDSTEGPQKGEFALMVMATPMSDLEGMEAKAAFEMMAGFMASESGDESAAPEVKDIKLGDTDAYRVDMSMEEDSDGFIIGFEQGDNMIIVAGVSAKGELGDHEDTALKIIETLEYTAP